ncbi:MULTISPECIES: NADP-dependent oxidoreductase [unclassified Rathayibacter]|uniref:NADP-dependent oxidoreductase n=1 Tax=unclassified Rathayibacter TaxID=2609250 RepID=UPI000F4C45ED|nr:MULTISPECIES: NADP-dependent oxidoreductase [unclassified Rathayibacter]ROP44363.1 NADPH:quinone reductase-like Zn-dependent oxidoreductase [Rathayibacter sp. PhB186]ROQ52614.1 NADPH:quinone reductase-like Zn-dependent oxidoreductase [Rathayibacter sp. PhB152]ROS46969.1 NADPH:quinone reductase-like Zn-dependent oxidoreductase [Rathayibacter sp. PhB185]TCL83123.1 NADPH:quinone reductase-like Zn-dependent oxidoreductase [Rathayibacter sp. PhB192]TCM28621.1 NADPH:quinone reductase-like Zn-depe
MKAYTITRYKGEVTETDVPEPILGEHDLLVRVHAAGVNHLDVKLAEGEFKAMLRYELPLTLGHDVAGVVESIGPAVTQFAVGDEVFARPTDFRIGTFAERIAIADADVALKPASLSMVDAASLPLVALTAWQALVESGDVTAGSRVLIHGGAGGFGSIAIQLAKGLGAYVATTASGSNAEWLRELGADEVIDYRSQRFEQVLQGYDLVVDGIGGENLEKSLRVLRPGGRAIGIAGPPDPAFARALGLNPGLRLAIGGLSASIRWQARRLGVKYTFLFMHADGRQLAEIAALVEAGVLHPVVGRVFPFAQTPAALTALERGGLRGKIVIAMDD